MIYTMNAHEQALVEAVTTLRKETNSFKAPDLVQEVMYAAVNLADQIVARDAEGDR